MLRAGPAACWLWVCGLAHCQSQLSDGFIPDDVLPMIGIVGATRAKRLADMLVTAGLFEREAGGYRIHDYLVYNDTKGEALTRKDAAVEQRRQAGIASGVSRRRRNEDTASVTNEPVQRTDERPLNPIPSHPIPTQPKNLLRQTGGAPLALGLRRLKVWRWMLDDLIDTLGDHAVAFDVTAWLQALDARETRVVERMWPWLKDELLAEVKRRGLPVASAGGQESTQAMADGVLEILRKQGAIS